MTLRRIAALAAALALAVLTVAGPAFAAKPAPAGKVNINTASAEQLTALPGVGPKLAARIVAEMKDKAPALAAVDPVVARLAGADDAKAAPKPVQDAISALVNLGYGRPQAAAAVAASIKALGEAAETSALIRRGLKELAQ